MLACAESDSAQANTVRSRIFREYLHENEFLSKTILACLSGAQMASFHEIKKWQKISWHCPFNYLFFIFISLTMQKKELQTFNSLGYITVQIFSILTKSPIFSLTQQVFFVYHAPDPWTNHEETFLLRAPLPSKKMTPGGVVSSSKHSWLSSGLNFRQASCCPQQTEAQLVHTHTT